MLHKNAFSPDTCDCKIEFSFDDALPAEQRVCTGVRIMRKCAAHEGVDDNDPHAHYLNIMAENQSKNLAFEEVRKTHPELFMDYGVVLEDDDPVEAKLRGFKPLTAAQKKDTLSRTLKQGIEYAFSFTGKNHARKLVVELKGASLKTAQKAALKGRFSALPREVEVK